MKQEVSPTYSTKFEKKYIMKFIPYQYYLKIFIYIILFNLLNTNNRRGRDCTFLNFKLISNYFNYQQAYYYYMLAFVNGIIGIPEQASMIWICFILILLSDTKNTNTVSP